MPTLCTTRNGFIDSEETASANDRPDRNPRKVLVVAYHFPPLSGSSGFLRSLKHCLYLPEHGWLPAVLTVNPRAYERTDPTQLQGLPFTGKIYRVFALDTRKHLSLRGHYLRCTALPDRWVSWCLGALPRGLFEIYTKKIDVIFTTFPIATAVLIGYILHRITGVPWVADFRDPMTEENYPPDRQARRVLRWLEKKAVRHASRMIFTAPSTMEMYLNRYPNLRPEKCLVIANGYDEQDFAGLSQDARARGHRVRMVHSGLIYPEERDPIPFFRALARLKKENRINAAWFSVDLRASGNEEHYRAVIADLMIEDLVHLLPALPYRQALQDANNCDVLLLMQAASCNGQIPAKAYEYLRLNKPILALTSKTGDTAALLNECGGTTILNIADEEAIYGGLPDFLASIRAGSHLRPRREVISKYSRRNQAAELAQCFSELVEADVAVETASGVNP